jgi:superfamily II DNA or RNA helicase
VQAVEGIVAKTLELEPSRQAIGFFPGVKSAEYATERFNALDPASTGFISAKTDPTERDRITADYRSGKLRRLMNVGIAIEGFDAPATSLILMGRPTKSRMFHAQSTGRGGRVLPGVVDGIPGRDGAAARRAAIAASEKPKLVVFDFVGNSSRHDLKLQSVEDLLGGDFSDEEVDLAKKKGRQEGGDVLTRLADARRELAAVAAAIRSKVSATVSSFNPFAVLDIDLGSVRHDDNRWGRMPPTENQLKALIAMKVPSGAPGRNPSEQEKMAGLAKRFSEREARKLLAERNKRHDQGLATYAQLAQLKRYGLDDKTVSFKNAGRALTYMAQTCGWKPERVDVKQLSWIASGGA